MKQLQHVELPYILQKIRAYFGKLALIKHSYVTTVSYITEQYSLLLSLNIFMPMYFIRQYVNILLCQRILHTYSYSVPMLLLFMFLKSH